MSDVVHLTALDQEVQNVWSPNGVNGKLNHIFLFPISNLSVG
jgi:hypothetical protein